jgi:RimJ/RimL family protein N-acetyltransferase
MVTMKHDILEELRQERKARGPLHHFSYMTNSERLEYEMLTLDNYSSIVEMFQDDSSDFIDERFKELGLAQQYATQVIESVYEAKYGGCDFLIKLKNTDHYIGILHLFDFSLENFSDVSQRCSIGFSIAEVYRRKYYATEAVKHLIQYGYTQYKKTKFLAYTDIPNQPANAFLMSLGMNLKNEDYYYGGQTSNYYVLEQSDSQ